MFVKEEIAAELRKLADMIDAGKLEIASTVMLHHSLPITKSGVVVDCMYTGTTFVFSTLETLPVEQIEEVFRVQPVSYGAL